MSSKGCLNGCVHNKEIKLDQMKEVYLFRCDAIKKYMMKEDVKSRCGKYLGKITIQEHSLDEFLD